MDTIDDTITEQILSRIGHNIRALRTAAGLTLKTAAERVEIHWVQWRKIEAGQVPLTVPMLVRLALSLRVDPAELLSGKPERRADLPEAQRPHVL